MKAFRLNRLLHPLSHRCLNVAIDHGFFNQPGFLHGIENLPQVIASLVEAGPDAIQLAVGQAHHLQALPGRQKPSLVLRVDTANIYGQQLPDVRYNAMIEDAAMQAVRLDAACVCVNLFQIPGADIVNAQCVANILRLKPLCDQCEMPMMVEPLVFQPNRRDGGYQIDGNENRITHLVRQAVELGADLVKADPTEEVTAYHKVVEVAGGVPVLVRGGGRVSDQEIIERTARLLEQGISGLVYGRNVIQHDKPASIVKSLLALLHDQATVAQALEILAGPTHTASIQ